MLSGGLIEKLGTVEAGGRITGDLVIEGDLTVEGSSSYVYDQKVEGGFIVEATATEALLIRKASDGGDVFTIDSTNEIIQINSHNGSSKGLKLGTTLVTADGGEINILDGATLSTAELNYVDGVTSLIQTQLDSKAPIANPTFTGNITIGSAEISEAELEVLDGLTVSTSEVNILTGVTSTSAELNYLDITTLGTAQASKAVTANASGNINFNNGNMTNVDIDSGAIDGTNITVGSGKTLDVSGGTFTLASNQISGDKIDGGTVSTFASTGIDDNASSNAITIDSSQNLALTSGTLTVFSEVNTGAGNRDIHLNPHGTGEVSVTATLDTTALKIASGTAMTAIKDEDNMASNSATSLSTQQSIKAYVDAVTASLNLQDLDFSGDSGGALNIDLDTESLTFAGGTGVATVGSGNTVTFNSVDSEIVHDSLSGFVADEHIAHSGVEVTAGTGLTGGGTIAATRTLNVIGGTGITANANDIATNDSEIVHDSLSGFVANEHIDHTAVTLTAGVGLSGGGTIAANRTFTVDLNELTTETTIADADFIAMVDATDDASGKITFENLEDAIFASVSGDITITEGGVASIGSNAVALATDTTGDYVQNITAGTGLTSNGATSGENIAHSLSVDANQTQIVQVGTLAVGAISSGFGAIDIGSSTANFGATTVDSLSASDGNITNVGDIALDSISADGNDINVAITNNRAAAFEIKQGSDKYFGINTTTDGDVIQIGTGISGTAITLGHSTSEITVADNLTITGNLKVNGDQVYQNVTQMAVTDPIISLQTGTDGANLGADTNKDVGLAMFWHNGSAAKTAFLGFDDSAGKLTFIPDASISSEVATGTAGTIVANLEGTVTGNVTGNTSGTALTVTQAAQTAITSLGTLTALTVDNIGVNGNTITANSGALNLTPASGSAIVLDGTISVDAGVVTGATSITSTAFVGNVTGNASGTALTVTQAAQTAITSVGTLTNLGIGGSVLSGNSISPNLTVEGTKPAVLIKESGRTDSFLGLWADGGNSQLHFDDSGIFSIMHADDTIGTNSTAVATFHGTGNVGIGTASPAASLHINTSANSPMIVQSTHGDGGYIELKLSDSGGAGSLTGYIGDSQAIVTSGDAGDLAIRAQGDFVVSTGGATERFKVDSSGKVGIGESVPLTSIHVDGAEHAILVGDDAFGGLHGGNAGLGTFGMNLYRNSSNVHKTLGSHASVGYGGIFIGGTDIKFYSQSGATTAGATVSPTTRMTLTNAGDLTITGRAYTTDGSASYPAYSFSDSNTGMYTAGADRLNFSTGGTERMMIRTGLSIKGAFVNSVDNNPDSYQISFGGDDASNPRWGFRVSDGDNGEDLYLDRNLNVSGRANALKIEKANGNATFAGKVTIDLGSQTVSPIKLMSSGKYVEIGALNASHVHFVTNVNSSSDFYFDGGVEINGSLSKLSGSFKIPHPLPQKNETHNLIHSFVESPQADNIYRGQVDLVGGTATVNIDTIAGMTDGTFIVLNREIQCFTSNESGWTSIKGNVSGNILTITAEDNSCTDTIHWLVIGERKDQHMYDRKDTDSDGKIILEPKVSDNDIQMRELNNA